MIAHSYYETQSTYVYYTYISQTEIARISTPKAHPTNKNCPYFETETSAVLTSALNSTSSSRVVHTVLVRDGSRWLNQRSRHCLPSLPGINTAILLHFTGCVTSSGIYGVSSRRRFYIVVIGWERSSRGVFVTQRVVSRGMLKTLFKLHSVRKQKYASKISTGSAAPKPAVQPQKGFMSADADCSLSTVLHG